MEWNTALPDWERRIVAGESLIPVEPLFPAEAADALDVFSALKIVDMGNGDDSPTMGDLCRPWIKDFVAAVFGAYDPEKGRRLISEFFLLISKKNTKSTTAAGIMLTALLRNWRQSGEFLILAPTKEIADNSFFPARDMVRHDPELSALLHVQPNIRQITHRETEATLKVVAADSDTVGGKKAIGVLVDELWLLGKQPNAENMLREATGGLASRPEGFTIFLTTQSDAPPAGVFKQKLDYARGVRDGRIKDRKFLPVLYEFPKAMIEAKEYEDPKNFYVTNPNLGASVDVEYIEREFEKAKEGGVESLPGFYAKSLDVEIGLGLQSDRWAGAEHWEFNNEPSLTLKELLARSEVVEVGVDGGGMDDMLGLNVLGREVETGKWLSWSHAWIHECVLERRKGEASKFRDFEKAGELTIIANDSTKDISDVADIVEEVEASGLLDCVGVDPAGIGAIVDAIVEKKIEYERIKGVTQGWKLVGPIKTVERKLAAKGLRHAKSLLMAYSVGNAKVVPAGNAIIITKQVSGSAKIDPLMALFNSAALMSLNPKPRKKRYQLLFV